MSTRGNTRRGRRRRASRAAGRRAGQPALAPPREPQGCIDCLSPCAKLYASALIDPFNTPAGACYPDDITDNTYRGKFQARFTGQIGTLGVGFIAAHADTGAAKDIAAYTHSQTGWTGNALDADSATPGVAVGVTNSPFAAASFGTGAGSVQSRVVAFGLRVRYTGTELNKAGVVWGLRAPSNTDMNGYTITQFSQYQESKPRTFGRDWVTVLWSPTDAEAANFVGNLGSSTATAIAKVMLGVIVTGTPGESFEGELFYHYEFLGAVPNKLPSESDTNGLSAVSTIIRRPQYQGAIAGKPHKKTFLQRVASYALAGASGVGRWIAENPGVLARGAAALATLA